MTDRLHSTVAAAIPTAVQAALQVALAALARLLLIEGPFVELLVFASLVDLVSSPWDAGRFVGLARLPKRVYQDPSKRFAQHVAILLVGLSIANVFPHLVGWGAEYVVLFCAVRASSGTLAHVLPADHPFRRIWAQVERRVERLWDVVDAPAETPPLDADVASASDPADDEPSSGDPQ